jgi:hypothetical protein
MRYIDRTPTQYMVYALQQDELGLQESRFEIRRRASKPG